MENVPQPPVEALANCPQCGYELDLAPPDVRSSMSAINDFERRFHTPRWLRVIDRILGVEPHSRAAAQEFTFNFIKEHGLQGVNIVPSAEAPPVLQNRSSQGF